MKTEIQIADEQAGFRSLLINVDNNDKTKVMASDGIVAVPHTHSELATGADGLDTFPTLGP